MRIEELPEYRDKHYLIGKTYSNGVYDVDIIPQRGGYYIPDNPNNDIGVGIKDGDTEFYGSVRFLKLFSPITYPKPDKEIAQDILKALYSIVDKRRKEWRKNEPIRKEMEA